MLFEKFGMGINLGGFLSQYEIVADLSSEETKTTVAGRWGSSSSEERRPRWT